MYKVMVRDNMSPRAKEIMEATGKIEVVIDNDKETAKPENLAKIIGEYHGLAVRSATKVTPEVLAAAKNLKVVGRGGIGVDNIDTKTAAEHNVVVMNAPGGNTRTTAEHAIAMMFAVARNIPQGTASLRAGKWEKKQLGGVEIMDKTLGIAGLGNIGKLVAGMAQGLNMKVIAADPVVPAAEAKALGVELVALADLYAHSDFISLHVPALKETVNMINAESLAQMKAGVRIINCSRGNVIDLDALAAALDSGHVAGAALDVLPKEPPEADLPILQHPKVIFTPHLGASTSDAQIKVADIIANQMAAYLIDGVIKNSVNFPDTPA